MATIPRLNHTATNPSRVFHNLAIPESPIMANQAFTHQGEQLRIANKISLFHRRRVETTEQMYLIL
jgi:hypothetical protein